MLALLPALALAAQTPAQPAEALASAMAGTWSSDAQAAADPRYDRIQTRITRLPNLSPEAPAAVWLFTESAMEAALDRPYRRNATRLSVEPDGRIRAASFRLKDPARPLAGVAAADLAPLEGCDALFTAKGAGAFEGAMAPGACRNHYKGADWLDSRTTVSPGALLTWDRGMADAGVRVWGPEAGGYRFARVAP